MDLILELTGVDILTNTAFGSVLVLFHFFLQIGDNLSQISDLTIFFDYFLGNLLLGKSFGVVNASFHSHKIVVVGLKLFNIGLKLLSILQQFLMLFPNFHGAFAILQLLNNVIILSFKSPIFLVHH